MFILQPLLLLIVSFVLLWIGSGLAVSSVTKIAAKLHASSFYVSFLLLGILTSLTEIVVGTSAFLSNRPDVFVGNLLGSSMVVFLLIVPLLAILGKGVSLNHTFSFRDLSFAAFVVGIPAVMTLDNNITVVEAYVLVLLYVYLLVSLRRNTSTLPDQFLGTMKSKGTRNQIFKVLAAVLIIIAGGYILINQTILLGEILQVPSFVISLILVSIGTNVPELSIGIRAIMAKKKGVAFGNYVGSAAFNTFQLGILSILHGKTIPAEGSNYSIILYVIGLVLFIIFARSKKMLSRQEGFVLFLIYFLLVVFEFVTGPGWKFL